MCPVKKEVIALGTHIVFFNAEWPLHTFSCYDSYNHPARWVNFIIPILQTGTETKREQVASGQSVQSVLFTCKFTICKFTICKGQNCYLLSLSEPLLSLSTMQDLLEAAGTFTMEPEASPNPLKMANFLQKNSARSEIFWHFLLHSAGSLPVGFFLWQGRYSFPTPRGTLAPNPIDPTGSIVHHLLIHYGFKETNQEDNEDCTFLAKGKISIRLYYIFPFCKEVPQSSQQ